MPDVRAGMQAGSRVLPARPGNAAMIIAAFTGVLYLIEAADTLFDGVLQREGIKPRHLEGLEGILWAPLLHGSWQHLAANTVPVLVLGFLALAGGIRQFVAVTATIWLVGGLGTWLIGRDTQYGHIGASVLVFGWLVFLIARGFFARRVAQIALGVALFLIWGGILWGVLPGNPGISWEGHLFGALGGLVAAWFAASADRPGLGPTHADHPWMSGS